MTIRSLCRESKRDACSTSEMEFGRMGTSKSKTTATAGGGFALARFLWRPQNRGLVVTGIVVLAAIAGSVYGWRRWGEPSISSPEYLVTAERISVTPQPAWIHANVKAEVVRS